MDELSAILADGHPSALAVAMDYCEEAGLAAELYYLKRKAEQHMVAPPFAVGQEWLLQTLTLYWVGRVKDLGIGWVLLEESSWVHWTGRLGVLAKNRKFTGAAFGSRKPRTEYVGDVLVSTDAIVSAIPGPWGLPGESVE